MKCKTIAKLLAVIVLILRRTIYTKTLAIIESLNYFPVKYENTIDRAIIIKLRFVFTLACTLELLNFR